MKNKHMGTKVCFDSIQEFFRYILIEAVINLDLIIDNMKISRSA
jgi:hypothetical protein